MVAQGVVWSEGVVLLPPSFDGDLDPLTLCLGYLILTLHLGRFLGSGQSDQDTATGVRLPYSPVLGLGRNNSEWKLYGCWSK